MIFFLLLWAIFHEIEILSFSTNHIVFYIAIVFGCGWFYNPVDCQHEGVHGC